MMLLKIQSFFLIFQKIFNYIQYSVQKTCKKHEKTRWFVSPKNVFSVCLWVINIMRKTVKLNDLDSSSAHVFEAIPRAERPQKWCFWKFGVLCPFLFATITYTRQFEARAEKSWFLNQKCSGLLKIIKSEHAFYSIASLSCSKPCSKPWFFRKSSMGTLQKSQNVH